MREFDGELSEFRQGYQAGYAAGYADAIKQLKKDPPEPKPMEIWYDTKHQTNITDATIDNALCPTCGAEANAACRGCED